MYLPPRTFQAKPAFRASIFGRDREGKDRRVRKLRRDTRYLACLIERQQVKRPLICAVALSMEFDRKFHHASRSKSSLGQEAATASVLALISRSPASEWNLLAVERLINCVLAGIRGQGNTVAPHAP